MWLKLKEDFYWGNTNESLSNFSSKNLDKLVIFSFKFIWTHNTYCLSNSKDIKRDLKAFYYTLSTIENMTWRNFFCRLKKEKLSSNNYNLLNKNCDACLNWYWHFDLNWATSWVGRIFWWYKDEVFYIIFVDINWKINRSAHK